MSDDNRDRDENPDDEQRQQPGRKREDVAREEEMTARLLRLREEGDTVAVVGIDHLDSIAERLNSMGEAASPDGVRDH